MRSYSNLQFYILCGDMLVVLVAPSVGSKAGTIIPRSPKIKHR